MGGSASRTQSLFFPHLEVLEGRFLPSVAIVTTTADSGITEPDLPGSLRAALDNLGGANGPNTIIFQLPSGSVIKPIRSLPPITGSQLTIDGLGNSSTPQIVLDGSSIPLNGDLSGLDISGQAITIQGLDVINFPGFGLQVSGSTGLVIQNNYIGIDLAGLVAPNLKGGVEMNVQTSGCSIGGTTAAARNVISGNGVFNIDLDGGAGVGGRQANLIQGNFIGTDVHGTTALSGAPADTDGIFSLGANGCTVGGTFSGESNVISGNTGNGINFKGNMTNDVIQGNMIGTDRTGTVAVPNVVDGMDLVTNPNFSNTVGGTVAGAGNLISGNGRFGIFVQGVPNGGTYTTSSNNVLQGNIIGLSATGAALGNALDGIDFYPGATNNTIGGTTPGAGNVIAGNLRNGIVLSGTFVTGNLIEGNQIGTNSSHAKSLGNGFYGIGLFGAANNNTIGGTLPAAGNVIGGNGQFGVLLSGPSGTLLRGNSIGVSGSGATAIPIPNALDGVAIVNTAGNTIGGATAGAGNVISGNGRFGVFLADSGSIGNVLQGNRLGTDSAGTAAVPNTFDGMAVLDSANGNTIGGIVAGAGNVLSGNGRFGLFVSDAGTGGNVVEGNDIGLTLGDSAVLPNVFDGMALLNGATGNTIGGTAASAGNSIAGNGRFGILLGANSTVVQGNAIGTNLASARGLGNLADGIAIFNSASNTIGGSSNGARNIISGNAGFGIYLDGSQASGNLIQGNLVGTDAAGTVAVANGVYGVLLASGANGNTIGGRQAGQSNLVSGNTDFGVYLLGTGTSGNVLEGNLIGVNLAATAALANGVEGVEVLGGASANTIGGTVTNAGNVISGNGRNGILIAQTGSDNNLVQGNFIGTDRTGTLLLGNGFQGVGMVESAARNTVGGTVSGAANTIAFNTSTGVTVGTSASDTASVGNAILGNSIHNNGGTGGLGIDLGNNGVTANGSGPSGPNHFQNHPTFSGGPTLGNNTVTATVSFTSVPSSTFRLEFFLNPTTDTSPQGRTFLGAVSVTTDTNGNLATATALTAGVTVGTVNTGNNTVSVTLPLPATTTAGSLTATATTLSVGAGQTASVGDTSEFSAAAVFGP
jgi:hypothetical protein